MWDKTRELWGLICIRSGVKIRFWQYSLVFFCKGNYSWCWGGGYRCFSNKLLFSLFEVFSVSVFPSTCHYINLIVIQKEDSWENVCFSQHTTFTPPGFFWYLEVYLILTVEVRSIGCLVCLSAWLRLCYWMDLNRTGSFDENRTQNDSY